MVNLIDRKNSDHGFKGTPLAYTLAGLLLGFSTWTFCLHAQASNTLGSSFIVNAEVIGEVPSYDSGTLQTRVTQLLQFLEQDVSSKVPAPLLARVRAHSLKIILREDAPTDEVFQPSESNPDDLEILLRPSILMSDDAFELLAHAYFHAIHYVIHPNEAPWIREGLAQTFEYIVLGRFNASHVLAAFQNPGTPLMGSYSVQKIIPAQYGHDLQYFYYLYSECGEDSLFWKIAQGKGATSFGISSVDFALQSQLTEEPSLSAKEQCTSFDKSATSFEVARTLNSKSYTSPNSSRYFLWSTSLRPADPESSMTPDLQTRLKNLERFQPISFASSVTLRPSDISDLKHFWIQKQFPFAVQENSPSSITAQWIQLVFKP